MGGRTKPVVKPMIDFVDRPSSRANLTQHRFSSGEDIIVGNTYDSTSKQLYEIVWNTTTLPPPAESMLVQIAGGHANIDCSRKLTANWPS
ncbi:hypothetical protein J1614_004007 [Plenodomus biglobosus]|nr:hypothetical protein J1614_004007 [Plenodomus biglobosus]